MNEIISYIITLLLGKNAVPEAAGIIGYTNNRAEFSRYKLVIYPSFFFEKDIYGKKISLPSLPLKFIDNTPLLYGEPKTEVIGSTLILYADIIASTYFLISRYEEIVDRAKRDIHGRFPGKESLPGRAGFITRPVVDEYGMILRKLLRECGLYIAEPDKEIERIYLTHDVDSIAHYRNLKSVSGCILRSGKGMQEIKTALKSYFKGVEYDPWFTFPWLLDRNNSLKNKLPEGRCSTITFIKPGGGNHKEDKPHSDIYSKDFSFLFKLLNEQSSAVGLHPSYEAGINPAIISTEKNILELAAGSRITCSRHHFLCSREPEDMQMLIRSGITDDFTMGYADTAGFRLGTCRPVNWIDPVLKKLTALRLHPLTIMDISLSDKKYMHLDEAAAYNYSVKLIDETKRFGGDMCLLWHNTSLEKNASYHCRLYGRILDYLKQG